MRDSNQYGWALELPFFNVCITKGPYYQKNFGYQSIHRSPYTQLSNYVYFIYVCGRPRPETLCIIYFLDLVTLKFVRDKIWYFGINNHDTLIMIGW